MLPHLDLIRPFYINQALLRWAYLTANLCTRSAVLTRVLLIAVEENLDGLVKVMIIGSAIAVFSGLLVVKQNPGARASSKTQ